MPDTLSSMPPPPPTERGDLACQWLETKGLVAFSPTIRASDLANVRRDPFLYYLTRRLGLVSPLRYSEALSRGSWAHATLELLDLHPSQRRAAFERRISDRIIELRSFASAAGISDSKISDIVARERKDADTAYAWMTGAAALRFQHVPQIRDSIFDPFKDCIFVGNEVLIETTVRINAKRIRCACRIDRLYYSPSDNSFDILDYKTTAAPAALRASVAGVDQATFHYLETLHHFLQGPDWPTLFTNIPEHLPTAPPRVGEMAHLCIQKPTIRFGDKDRPYIWFSEGKRTGISAKAAYDSGQKAWVLRIPDHDPILFDTEEAACAKLHSITGKKPERIYDGEPRFDLYRKRCLDWFYGRGDYADNAEKHFLAPPIHYSFTSYDAIKETGLEKDYISNLLYVHDYATRAPHPDNFERIGAGLLDRTSLSPYRPFYDSPVSEWPYIMQNACLIQSPREGDEALEMETTDE